MKNDTSRKVTDRLQRGPLYWKPLAGSSKTHGEHTGNEAFVSLPAWPGYRDAGTSAPLSCHTAGQRLSVSDDTDPPREFS